MLCRLLKTEKGKIIQEAIENCNAQGINTLDLSGLMEHKLFNMLES